MNQVDLELLEPVKVIAIYERVDRGYYIESHDVAKGKLLAGKPLNRTQQLKLGHALIDNGIGVGVKFRGRIPSNLFSISADQFSIRMIWSNVSQRQEMFFRKELNIPNGSAWQPNLVYIVDRNEFKVFAYTDSILTEESQLFLVPYHNVSEIGSVCLGDIKLRKCEYIDDLMAMYEEVMFKSYFSHAGGVADLVKYNINLFWRNLIETGKKFPADKLIPTKLTISSFLN